jgi:hypothetical protein
MLERLESALRGEYTIERELGGGGMCLATRTITALGIAPVDDFTLPDSVCLTWCPIFRPHLHARRGLSGLRSDPARQ